MLHGPGKHTYRLYAMMDVFSRKVVGHRIERTETAAFAAELIRNAGAGNKQYPSVLHADNGAPMRAGTTVQLAQSLGITLSYSRPRVSDDNPYSDYAGFVIMPNTDRRGHVCAGQRAVAA